MQVLQGGRSQMKAACGPLNCVTMCSTLLDVPVVPVPAHLWPKVTALTMILPALGPISPSGDGTQNQAVC